LLAGGHLYYGDGLNRTKLSYTLKYLIAVTLIFITDYSFAQLNKSVDSLKKYSYFIGGDTTLLEGIGHSQGTAFFVKKGDKKFLVAAKHTLSGCDNFNYKEPRYPNSMKVLIPNTKLSINDTFMVRTAIIKDTANCSSFAQDADAMIYPLDKATIKKSKLNFINSRISKIQSKYASIIFWGFPKGSKEPKLFSSKNFTVEEFKLTKLSDGTFINDSINYYITIHDEDVNEGLIGFSGAPVFLQDGLSLKFAFLGVLSGTNNKERAL
jgi:hypothetical protein